MEMSRPSNSKFVAGKSTTSLTGPNDDVIISQRRTKAELGSRTRTRRVIGAKASYIEPKEVLDQIAGYTATTIQSGSSSWNEMDNR